MNERIQVVLKSRPIKNKHKERAVEIYPDQKRIFYIPQRKNFFVDHVYDETNQHEMFNECIQPLVTDVLKGNDATVFAYGQTNSGKTYTMFGSGLNELLISQNKDSDISFKDNNISQINYMGIVSQSCSQIFDYILTQNELNQNNTNSNDYLIMVSMIEIYNEKIYDLLSNNKKNGKKICLELREDHNKNFIVQNIEKHIVTNNIELMELIHCAHLKRHIGCTKHNNRSSRSHCIVTIRVEYNDDINVENSKIGRLTLVDLAGSEKLDSFYGKKSKKQNRETSAINASLSCLSDVIHALSTKEKYGKQIIPYRNSKLTKILKECLTQTSSKSLMIACINPLIKNYCEILSTLRFMTRVKKVKKDKIKEIKKKHESMLNILKIQLNEMKKKLKNSQYIQKEMLNSVNNININNFIKFKKSNLKYNNLIDESLIKMGSPILKLKGKIIDLNDSNQDNYTNCVTNINKMKNSKESIILSPKSKSFINRFEEQMIQCKKSLLRQIKQNNLLNKKLNEIELENKSLLNEKENYEIKYNNINNELNRLKKLINEKKELIKNLNENNNDQNNKINELKKQIIKYINKIENLKTEKKSIQLKNENIKKELEMKLKQYNNTKNKVDQNEIKHLKEFQMIKKIVDKQKLHINDCENKINEYKLKYNYYKDEIIEKNNQITKMKEKLTELKNKTKWNDELIDLKKNYKEILEINENIKNELNNKNNELKTIKNELNMVINYNESLKNEKNQELSNIKDKENENNELKEKSTKFEKKCKLLNTELLLLKTKYNQNKKNYKNEIYELKNKNKEKINKLKKEYNKEIIGFENKIFEVEKEKFEIIGKLNKLEKESQNMIRINENKNRAMKIMSHMSNTVYDELNQAKKTVIDLKLKANNEKKNFEEYKDILFKEMNIVINDANKLKEKLYNEITKSKELKEINIEQKIAIEKLKIELDNQLNNSKKIKNKINNNNNNLNEIISNEIKNDINLLKSKNGNLLNKFNEIYIFKNNNNDNNQEKFNKKGLQSGEESFSVSEDGYLKTIK